MKKLRLDYHEGLSWNQCQIVLKELKLDSKKFSKWMNGQTMSLIPRETKMGIIERIVGVYPYDLFRWVRNQKKGEPLIWD